MKRFATIAGALALSVGVLAAASFLTTFSAASCGYGQREYQLTFENSRGKPVPGVDLKVEDERGNDFFCFPVTDYVPGRAPLSDEQGIMCFHHISTAVEWDSIGGSLFGWITISTAPSPVFICRFLHRGKEVYRIPYGDLPDWDWGDQTWEEAPKVKRQWNWTAVTPAEIVRDPNESEQNYESRLARFFHIDGKDKRHREGVIARRNSCDRNHLFRPPLADKAEKIEELDFPVIRRTITIPVDSRD